MDLATRGSFRSSDLLFKCCFLVLGVSVDQISDEFFVLRTAECMVSEFTAII